MSKTGDEPDIILEPCVSDEKVCMRHSPRVSDEFFYFYSSFIEYFGVAIPFIMFQYELLRTLNVASSQFNPDSWAFSRAFEVIGWGLNIMLTIGIFFSFNESRKAYKVGWFLVNFMHGWPIISPYTSNYKDLKDRFLRVRGNSQCMELIYESDETYQFPIY